MDFRAVNVALDVFCSLISLLLLFYALLRAGKKSRMDRYFILICLFNIGMLVGDIPNWLCEGFGQPWFPAALWLGCLVQFLSGTWISLAYAGYLGSFLAPRTRLNKLPFYASGVLGALATLLVFGNLWNGTLYYIDAANVYHRGRFWILSQAVPVMIMLLTIVIVLRCRRCMSAKTMATFLLYQLIPFPAIVLQGIFYGLACTYPATTLALVIIFLNIQSEQAVLLEKQQREIAETNISVMLGQIQPHFLYNALTAVGNLCEIDPPRAQKAVDDFAKYLRGNMRALTQREPIAFSEELKHIRHYLALERVRFGHRLNIVMEIGPTDFLVPALSVQPIVENAVKHGVACRAEGGTVTLRTEETEEFWLITVTDDGPGFTALAGNADGREHVGIANVRSRLAAMVGGTLVLKNAPGQGTAAEITIPKGEGLA